jgi:hypothetical protein
MFVNFMSSVLIHVLCFIDLNTAGQIFVPVYWKEMCFTRAIWKATSGELLTKQAMRK